MSIYHGIAGKIHNRRTIEVLREIISECDVRQDGVLGFSESLTCWQFIETGEYMLNKLLTNSTATLDIYGTCGSVYAMQYANPEPFMGYKTSLRDNRTWKYRARLAIAILELIESIEHTPYGSLYLCDAQEANFGLVSVTSLVCM